MSQTYIAGMVSNMVKKRTSAYMPVIEAITNSIDAIDESKRKDGRITVKLIRDNQMPLDGSTPKVSSVEIMDNGVGFNSRHRDSFDTIYSPLKQQTGGKGFGRFLYLKHF